MKKNLTNIVLAVMVVAGLFMIETHTFVSVCIIGIVGGVLALTDFNKAKRYERAKENSKNIDYLLDCVEFGEWNVNV